MPQASLQPLAPSQRLVLLDAVRAVALAGILMMNLEAFNGTVLASGTGLDLSLAGADRWVDGLVYFFVQGKFFTLFSLLFGMGFAVMGDRAEAAGRPFAGFYFRRCLALGVIGVLHATLVWGGDILASYALAGLCLLPFAQARARWLLFPGIMLFLAAPAMIMVYGLLAWASSLDAQAATAWDQAMGQQSGRISALIAQADQAYAHGGWIEVMQVRLQEWGVSLSALPVTGPMILGMFLLGGALLRSGAMVRPQEWPRLLGFLRWGLLPLGMALMAASLAVSPQLPLDRFDLQVATAHALWMLASGMMSLGYLGWMAYLFSTGPGARLAAWLAPAGRMALSNYLLQSLVCTLLFYGYGLGWYGQVPRAWQPLLVLGVFLAQLLLSHAWLARFRFGPMEWVWRCLSYLRLQPMRRAAA